MKNKQVKQSLGGVIKQYWQCDSAELELVAKYVGTSQGITYYEFKWVWVLWYAPCGAPDSEWSERHLSLGKISLTANQLKGINNEAI